MTKRAKWMIAVALLAAGLGVPGTAAATLPPEDPCDAPDADMEGCFRYDDMARFHGIAVDVVRAFAEATYADPTTVEPAGGWQLIKTYTMMPSDCGELDHTAYAYCPADDTIYVGIDQLWSFYILQGDAAAVIGLAHEFGHALQMRAGVLAAEENQADAIAIENQADCVGGAFTRWADGEGMLAEDDLEDIDLLLAVIAASEEDTARTHGTLDERADSFILGLRDGIFACNDFFPAVPLTT